MLKLTLCARFSLCYYLVLRGSFASIGCPVVLPMAKYLNVKKEVNDLPLTPIVAGPGLKKALKEKLADVAGKNGSVAQYLNARFTNAEHRDILREKLMDFAPRRNDKSYFELTKYPPDGSAGCIHISDLGLFAKCSVRPWPQANVCSDIFDDILAKKIQSLTNPLVVTQCQLDAIGFPCYAYVKGMARACTVLALVIFRLMPICLRPHCRLSSDRVLVLCIVCTASFLRRLKSCWRMQGHRRVDRLLGCGVCSLGWVF